jgi:hypothetical protein
MGSVIKRLNGWSRFMGLHLKANALYMDMELRECLQNVNIVKKR